jgi:DNA repair protein RadC
LADAPDLGSGAFGCGGSTPPSRTFKLLAVASKKSTISSCPVTRGEVDLSKYEKLAGVWRELGISAPARRALVDAKLLKLSDLSKIKLEDLTALHGMGPKTIKTLKAVGAKFKK